MLPYLFLRRKVLRFCCRCKIRVWRCGWEGVVSGLLPCFCRGFVGGFLSFKLRWGMANFTLVNKNREDLCI